MNDEVYDNIYCQTNAETYKKSVPFGSNLNENIVNHSLVSQKMHQTHFNPG